MSFNTKAFMSEIDLNFLYISMMNTVFRKNEKPYCCRNVVCISFDVKNKKGVSNIFFFVLSRKNSKGVLIFHQLLIILDNLDDAYMLLLIFLAYLMQMQYNFTKISIAYQMHKNIKRVCSIRNNIDRKKWLLLSLMANKEEKEAEKACMSLLCRFCVSWSVDKNVFASHLLVITNWPAAYISFAYLGPIRISQIVKVCRIIRKRYIDLCTHMSTHNLKLNLLSTCLSFYHKYKLYLT